MPVFSLPLGPEGPIVKAVIGPSLGRVNALKAAGQTVPPVVSVKALLDTGASCTCVDPTVLQKLGLSPTGSTQVSTPSTGTTGHTADQYDTSVSIFASVTQSPLHMPATPVIACDFSAQGIDALIGRDILAGCVLVYNGNDRLFTLAF